MTHIVDGTMARQVSRPEVWYLQGGERHWVPDGQTVDSLGGWGAVQIVNDTIDNPIGDNYPSVIDGAKHYPDGNLLQASPAPEVYLMDAGQRRWIPDWQTFVARGYYWADVRHLSTPELNSIPLGPPLPSDLPAQSDYVTFDTGNVDLGAGHFMDTKVNLTRSTGRCTGQTRTFATTWFGGFHGAVYIILSDANDVPVVGGVSPYYRYGVDGRVIGNSDRTDVWSFALDPAQAALVRYVHIFHVWAPDDFLKILAKWQAASKPISDLIGSAASIAKVVAAAFA